MDQIKQLFKFIEDELGITKEELLEHNRKQHIVDARQIFVAIAKDKLGMSYFKIAKYLERDHTTCMSLYKRKSSRVDYFFKLRNEALNQPYFKTTYKQKSKWSNIFELRGGACEVCGFNDVVEVHHLLSKKVGGTDNPSNLIVLCPNHHSMLHAQLLHINPSSFPHLVMPEYQG